MKTFFLLLATVCSANAANVRIQAVPESGVQPQVAVDAAGTVHLVYLKGDPQACDVRYVCKAKGAREWSAPIGVNSESKTAVAMGTIRGAQIALGQRGTLHVVWNGSMQAGQHDAALFYSRLEPDQTKFAPQRNLLGDTAALDGGASVAANARGEVFAFWHGKRHSEGTDETARVVFTAKSADNGATFGSPIITNGETPGVCACCSLKAMAAPDGDLFTLYRAARTTSQRDMTLLVSHDGGATFQQRALDPWSTASCPMSSSTLLPTANGTRAAWETKGRIFSTMLGEKSAAPLEVSGENSKHPTMAVNTKGETLIAWAIGTGWKRGGELAWRIFDSAGKPSDQRETKESVPVWGFPAAYAEANGDFVILR